MLSSLGLSDMNDEHDNQNDNLEEASKRRNFLTLWLQRETAGELHRCLLGKMLRLDHFNLSVLS